MKRLSGNPRTMNAELRAAALSGRSFTVGGPVPLQRQVPAPDPDRIPPGHAGAGTGQAPAPAALSMNQVMNAWLVGCAERLKGLR